MKNFLDKAVVMLFSLLLILNIFSGSQKIIILFLMITVASFTSFLRMLGEKGILANKIIVVLIGICICIWPEAIVFTPLVAYEIFLDRHWIAGLVLVVGFARFCVSGDEADRLQAVDPIVNFDHLSICLFVFLETVLSIYLSYRTMNLQILETENKKIRDEGEIKKETLKKQNKNLMEEQDKSITSAQLAERNRIAREIHDNVGHMLSRSILQVGAMMVINKDEKMAAELKSLRETLDTAMNNIRNSVHDLRDEAIDLKSALEEIAEPLKQTFNVSLEFDADAGEVSKEIKYATINIVKESVSNIIKYSKNENVDIRFYEHPSMYQIIVHDYNQSGNYSVNQRTVPEIFAQNKTKGESGEGMGLENIRTRAEKLGGNATFTNENGFRVFVRIPRK
ncbi:MAG: hypothetical protein J6066_07155 [Lachnospiraceae bacterium]|nr:hypothetical protein [Lachnospiraceae bacterium]